MREMPVLGLAMPKGGEDALDAALAPLGLARPAPGHFTEAGGRMLLWAAPDAMLLLGEASDLQGAAYLTEQTDAWLCLSLEGDALPALARLCPLDLEAWKQGQGARTAMEHMAGFVLRTEAGWLLLAPSSFGESFRAAVEHALDAAAQAGSGG